MCSKRIVAVFAIILFSVAPSVAQTPQGNKAGTLACKLSPSIGLIIGSQQRMTCKFTPNGPYPVEYYVGKLTRIGLDIGITAGGGLAWGVFSPTQGPLRGALAGTYAGASGDIAVGVGVGANVLIGGSGRSITLQPLSVEGSVGLSLALGIAGLTLTFVQ